MLMQPKTPSRIEPCLLDIIDITTADRVADLVWKPSQLGKKINVKTASSLSDLIRITNCYYSNLIEGHKTKPGDIERALAEDLGSPCKTVQVYKINKLQ